jgi:hypothetical protein
MSDDTATAVLVYHAVGKGSRSSPTVSGVSLGKCVMEMHDQFL